jgi:hypothetical protein
MDKTLRHFLITNRIKSIGDIKWAHAVNNANYLAQSLANPYVDFLEVDISISDNGDLIAAHYSNESDLSFDVLLNKVKESNKGLKLDFKDQKALLPCLKQLQSTDLHQPVILNADILTAQNAPEAIMPPEWFVINCQNYYSRGILSPGWRTNPDPKATYTAEDIEKMQLLFSGISKVTFCVRALMLPGSWNNAKKLLDDSSRTLTVWETKPVNNELKDWIVKNTDPKRCFYDLNISI